MQALKINWQRLNLWSSCIFCSSHHVRTISCKCICEIQLFTLLTRLPEESQNNSKTIYDFIQLPSQLQSGKQYFWQKIKE